MAWDGDFEMLLGSAEALRTKATRVRRQLELQGHVAAVLREHTQLIEQLTQHYNNFIRRARQAVGVDAPAAAPDGPSDGAILAAMPAAEAQRLLRLLLNVIGWAHDSRIAESRVRCVLWLGSLSRFWPDSRGTWCIVFLQLLVILGTVLVCTLPPVGTEARWALGVAAVGIATGVACYLFSALAADHKQRRADIPDSIARLHGVPAAASQLAAELREAGLLSSCQLVESIKAEVVQASQQAETARRRLRLPAVANADP